MKVVILITLFSCVVSSCIAEDLSDVLSSQLSLSKVRGDDQARELISTTTSLNFQGKLCSVCQKAMDGLENLLKKNATIDQVVKFGLGICNTFKVQKPDVVCPCPAVGPLFERVYLATSLLYVSCS